MYLPANDAPNRNLLNDRRAIALGRFVGLARQNGPAVNRGGDFLLNLFFVLLPFPISIIGEGGSGNVSAADAVAGVALVSLVGGRALLGSAGKAVLVFLAVAALSAILSSKLNDAVLGLGRMALVTLAPLLMLSSHPDPWGALRRGLRIFTVGSAVLGLFSLYFFATKGIGGSMGTLGINKNSQGPIFGSAVVIIVAGIATLGLEPRRRVVTFALLALNLTGLLLCLSRGGWVGTAVGILVIVAATGRVRAVVVSVLIFGPILGYLWSLLPAESVDYATNVSTDSYVLRARFDTMQMAMDAFHRNPILGVGVGLRRTVEPHNVFVLTLGETGVLGVLAFTGMVAAAARTLVLAVVRLPKRDPRRAVFVAALAAFTVYHVQTLIDVYWRRGVGALSWACVGAAVAAVYANPPAQLRREVGSRLPPPFHAGGGA